MVPEVDQIDFALTMGFLYIHTFVTERKARFHWYIRHSRLSSRSEAFFLDFLPVYAILECKHERSLPRSISRPSLAACEASTAQYVMEETSYQGHVGRVLYARYAKTPNLSNCAPYCRDARWKDQPARGWVCSHPSVVCRQDDIASICSRE